jgi:phthalate 4,5-dioxygenase oxygenase subunit
MYHSPTLPHSPRAKEAEMLSAEDTELLCRVGPGTPMGDLMRRYWMPVVYGHELPPDGQPMRVRVLGEDLLAWRDTQGRPSFIEDRCAHRGVSLYFGRNEEGGLRCAYHGWKYDVTGQCIDMPNEPAESNFKNKVKMRAYGGADFGAIVWAYMGPDQANPPAIPRFEWGLVPEEQITHGHRLMYECNWMQALEGELDSTHVYFLHSRLDPKDSPKYGLYLDERRAKFHLLETDVGLSYGAERYEDEEHSYWRTTHFLLPIYGMWPGASDDGTTPLSIYLPVDDEHTVHFGVFWHPTKALGETYPKDEFAKETGALGPGVGPMLPPQTDRYFPNAWPMANPRNNFLMDLEAKRTKNFTGIPTVRLQDSAVIWSMGPIMDRTREHLGTMDATVIKVRRKLLAAAKALRDHDTAPPGVDDPELYRVRSCAVVLPKELDWETALNDWHHCRTDQHPNPGFVSKRAGEG